MPPPRTQSTPPFRIYPVTPSRWHDLETLFGKRGACGGCWCMAWRLKSADFEAGKGEKNRRAMKRLVESGRVPGMIAYHKGEPIAWCSLGPREHFPRLENARTLKPVDERKVWSVTCLFVAKDYRRQGVSVSLLKAAADHAKKKRAAILEGYPYDLTGKKSPLPDPFVWTGLHSAYQKAGFIEVARRSPARPIMRAILK